MSLRHGRRQSEPAPVAHVSGAFRPLQAYTPLTISVLLIALRIVSYKFHVFSSLNRASDKARKLKDTNYLYMKKVGIKIATPCYIYSHKGSEKGISPLCFRINWRKGRAWKEFYMSRKWKSLSLCVKKLWKNLELMILLCYLCIRFPFFGRCFLKRVLWEIYIDRKREVVQEKADSPFAPFC